MISAQNRALGLVNENFSYICQGHAEKITRAIIKALKEQDKITHHAVLDNVGKIKDNPCCNCGPNHACDSCIERAIINTKAV